MKKAKLQTANMPDDEEGEGSAENPVRRTRKKNWTNTVNTTNASFYFSESAPDSLPFPFPVGFPLPRRRVLAVDPGR